MCCAGWCARERWKFNVYIGAVVFSLFTSKMLVLFVLMAEDWWQDSGPIKLFLEQIGP